MIQNDIVSWAVDSGLESALYYPWGHQRMSFDSQKKKNGYGGVKEMEGSLIWRSIGKTDYRPVKKMAQGYTDPS
jgi:hypothetical protein